MCWSLFNKVAGLRPATILKKNLNAGALLSSNSFSVQISFRSNFLMYNYI